MEKLYPVLGNSMRPLLEPGDAVAARPCAPGELRSGDIALLVRWSAGLPSGYVLHRVLFNLSFGPGRLLLTRGDANVWPDWPPSAFQAAGLAVALERGGARSPLPRGSAASLVSVLYSFCANRLLNFVTVLGAWSFLAARLLLPAFFAPQLNALYLAWESRLYPALLRLVCAPARPRGTPRPAARGQVKSGFIRTDETWSGRVTVADYLTIVPGAAVTLLPGTEVLFERREPWSFPVLRAGDGGEDRSIENAGAKILVYGGLNAAGTPERPVRMGGKAFSGLYALGAGRISLSHTELGGSRACALSARDGAALSARGCHISACGRGAEVCGGASAALEDCTFSDCAGPALLAADHACAQVYGGSCSLPAGTVAELSGHAAAGFARFGAGGCAAGVKLSGKAVLRLESCDVSGLAGRAADCSGRAVLRVLRSSFSANKGGLRASGLARLEAEQSLFARNGGPAAQLRGRAAAGFSGCSFQENRGPALEISGPCRAELRGCTFHGGETAADVLGRARLLADRCDFDSAAGVAVRAERLERLELSGCRFFACKAGLRAGDCLRAEVSGTTFEGGGPALCVSGQGSLLADRCTFRANSVGADLGGEISARLTACRFDAQAGAPLLLSGRASAVLEGCAFTANASGAALSDRARAQAEGCTFGDNRGPAFELAGEAQLAAQACRVSGQGSALLAAGRSSVSLTRVSAQSAGAPAASLCGQARLSASGSSFTSATDAVYARGAASLDISGCVLAGGSGAALDLDLRAARLRGVLARGAGGLLAAGRSRVTAERLEIRASEYAIDFSGESLRVFGLLSDGGRKGGVRIASGCALLRGAVLTGAPYPGLAAGPGAGLRASRVSFEGAPWTPQASRAGASRARAALFRFVSATAGLPGFSLAYRLFYLAAVRAAALLLSPGKGGSLYLYRGMAAKGWVAGLSDMDLAALSAPAPAGEDWLNYRRLCGRLRWFRALFPFTGEVLCAPAPHFLAFMSSWGVKGGEFSAASRLLAGRAVKPEPRADSGQADLTEAFYAYTLLLSHYFSAALPPAFRARNCLKSALDIRRYLDAGSAARASRQAYAAAVGADLGTPPDPADAAFESFSALHSACPAAAYAPAGGTSANPAWFNTHAFEGACAALEAAAGCETGVALDALYRVYVVLPDALAQDKAGFLRAAAAFRGARAAYFSASPLLLTRSAFQALAALPYLNNPLFWQDLCVPSAGGASPADGGVFLYKVRPPAAPAPALTQAAARLAAAHFAASWRSLWGAMPAHYFYTRAAGLRLLLRTGASPAFSRPAELSGAFLAAFGAGLSWAQFSAGGAGRTNYEFVARQAAALMEPRDGG